MRGILSGEFVSISEAPVHNLLRHVIVRLRQSPDDISWRTSEPDAAAAAACRRRIAGNSAWYCCHVAMEISTSRE